MIPVEVITNQKYEGWPMLEFRYKTKGGMPQVLKFGTTKAIIILENLEVIREFVERNRDVTPTKTKASETVNKILSEEEAF